MAFAMIFAGAAPFLATTPAEAQLNTSLCSQGSIIKVTLGTTTYDLCVTDKAAYSDSTTLNNELNNTPWNNTSGKDNQLAKDLANAVANLYTGSYSIGPNPPPDVTSPSSPWYAATNAAIPNNGKLEGPAFFIKENTNNLKAASYSCDKKTDLGGDCLSVQKATDSGVFNENTDLSFVLGAIDPAPGPLPLLGAGAAFGWSRRLRRRTRTSAEAAADSLRPLPVASSTEACL